MKITLDIKDGLAATINVNPGTRVERRIDLQDGMLLKVESVGQVALNITAIEPKSMQASSESGASGSLSFA
ncbi:hypothetical protein LCGC14_0378150 [marine sediment metagenome]|uniref:Uncharacterized protein n=1 Tax=marine sediment metagenome TaxID=412755 RepID=A0A0F9TLA9_9ZZZZ